MGLDPGTTTRDRFSEAMAFFIRGVFDQERGISTTGYLRAALVSQTFVHLSDDPDPDRSARAVLERILAAHHAHYEEGPTGRQ